MASSGTSLAGLRVGVIGVGRMGQRHIQAAQRLGMHVCGIADRSQDALAAAQSAHGIEPSACFADAMTLLDRTRPDALVIATTAPTHAEFTVGAAERGVQFILCEKPMATSLADADRMIEACQRHGSKLAVNHQMRFLAQYTAPKALIDSDELGPLTSVLVAGSNFGLAMNASHYFEMFRYVTGRRVRGVQAWLENINIANPRGPEFVDRAGRLLAWGETGQSLYIDCSANAGHGLQVVFICRNGQITIDELTGEMRVTARKPEFRELPTTRYAMPHDTRNIAIDPVEAVTPTMAVWKALLNGDSYPDGDTGIHALTCLVAAHASNESGGNEVRLVDPSLSRTRVFPWA